MNSANRYTPNPKRMRRQKPAASSESESEKDVVHVYCRLRPLKEGADPTPYIKLIAADTLAVTTPPETKGVTKEVHYKFKHVFSAFSSQSELFSHIAYPLLEDLLCAKNALLFTYGVTGSGKTYTLNGDQNNPGILPRCLNTIFNSIIDYQAPKCVIKSDRMNGFEVQTEDDAIQDRLNAMKNFPKTPKAQRKASGEKIAYTNDGMKIQNINEKNLFTVFISYVEIYNNIVFDLLDESSGKTLQNKILREDPRRNMYVNGVVEIEIKSAEEGLEVFQIGQNRKRMAATTLNSDSSRSHSIFNIRVVQLEQMTFSSTGRAMVPNENVIKVGQLSLVDLAGSERTNRTNNTGMRLKEASSINNSLMSLRTCLEILKENQRTKGNRLVPYRDSRLTFLFKNYFEGNGTVKMIVCLNPSMDDYEESLQVLKFAEITQDVKIAKAEVRYTPLKKTMKRNKENATPGKLKSSMCTLLPDVPIVRFDWENVGESEVIMEKIIKILKLRKQKAAALNQDVEEKQTELRKRLMEINQDNVLSKAEIKSLKSLIHKEKQDRRKMEVKITNLETENEDLNSKNVALQNVVQSLHHTISEKDLKINHNILEKERTKQQLVRANEKMTQELDAKLRRQRDHINAAMKAKDEKLRILKQVIDSETPPVELNHIDLEPEYPKNETLQTPITNGSSTNQYRRNMVTSTPRPRRSRSAGEYWLEHNAVKPCPLGTVFQPTMKKRKSVAKLNKASDVTNPKQSKYCLIAQEQDTEGEMETKLYKADIVPTCGGGAQVIFNDVERLRQESPTRSPK